MSRPDRVPNFVIKRVGGSTPACALRVITGPATQAPLGIGACRKRPPIQPALAAVAPFSAERRPGAFLTASAIRSPGAGTAVAGLCVWRDLTADEIEAAALSVLRRNLKPHRSG